MKASAECCNSVTIDGRTEQVPLSGDHDAAVAPTSATSAGALDTRPGPTYRLEGINAVAHRSLDARTGYRLLLHFPNRRAHRGGLHRR